MQAIRNHFCFQASQDVKPICEGYFTGLPLHVAGQLRVFYEGEYYFLTSFPEWAEWGFVDKAMPPLGFVNHHQLKDGIYFPKMDKDVPVLGWKNSEVILSREQFNIQNPMLIIKKYQDFYDVFCLDIHLENAYEFYLTQQNTIEHFLAYFKENTQDQHLIANQNRIKVDADSMALLKLNQQKRLAEPSSLTLSQIHSRELYHRQSFTKVSEREYECLELLAKGGTAKSIANILSISPRTVETHLTSLKTKFDLSSKQELIALYYENRLLK